MHAGIDRHACLGCKRDAFGPGASERGIAQWRKREENKRLVFLHDALRVGWMRIEPIAYRLQRDRLSRERAARHQNSSNRCVTATVGGRKGQPADRTIHETDSARTLDIQEKRCDRIVGIEQNGSIRQSGLIYFGTRRKGHQLCS